MEQLCQHGCGQPATYTTKSSLKSGPFKGAPVHQCAKSHNACPAIKAKKVATSLKNYGTEYPWQTSDVMEKRHQTNIKRYGNAFSLKNDEVAEKRKNTLMERYGVEQPTLNPEIRKRAAAGVRQSYINDPTLASRQVQSKREKYGPDLKSVVEKTRDTQVANGRWVDPAKQTEWANYKRRVKRLTTKTYNQYKHIINPDNLPTGACAYQVDHIYSIRHGFENDVAPAVIAHVANLRMMWHVDNKSKHIRSDITLEELIAKTKGA